MASGSRKRVRYAVVGLGNIAQAAVLPAFKHAKENSELVGLVSSDEKKLRELGARYDAKLTAPYESLERLIVEAEIDAVYVAVPNSLHRDIAVRAARTGAHVLCEKPMACTEEDCRAMIRAAKENGVKLMIAYRLHFEEANLEAIERIRAGEIGEPKIFTSVFSQQVREGDVRTRDDLGGGAMFDMGVYCVNAARYLFRDEPVEVYAQQVVDSEPRFRNIDEMTMAVLRFPGNRFAQMTASQGAADVSEFRVVGTRGDLRLEPAYGYGRDARLFVTREGKREKKSFSASDQFAPELLHFSRCILEGGDPEPSGLEGLEDVRIIQAMIRSAQTGGAVAITPAVPPTRPTGDLMMRKPPVGRIKTVHAPSPIK